MTLTDGVPIEGLFVGQPRAHWPGKPASAIVKTAADGVQVLTLTGLAHDQQADLAVHGGPHKAVHHYAAEHYATWIAEGMIAPGTEPAAFGENLSTRGLTEDNVCIGDIFRLGSALVQVSQGRQPCWKLNLHTGQPLMALRFQQTLRTGWYYRVLETGGVCLGDALRLIDRPQPGWTVAAVTRARLQAPADRAVAGELAQLAELAPGWRGAFARFAGGDVAEDTSARLG